MGIIYLLSYWLRLSDIDSEEQFSFRATLGNRLAQLISAAHFFVQKEHGDQQST